MEENNNDFISTPSLTIEGFEELSERLPGGETPSLEGQENPFDELSEEDLKEMYNKFLALPRVERRKMLKNSSFSKRIKKILR